MFKEALNDITSVYKFERKLFILVGTYPKPKCEKALFYYPRTVMTFLLTLFLAVPMIISLIIGVDDVQEVSDIMYYLMSQIAYLSKLVNFVIGFGKIRRIEIHLAKPITYKFMEKYGFKYMVDIMKYTKILANAFRSTLFAALVFYATFPLLDEATQLPFAGWLPVDKVRFRTPIYILQVVAVISSGGTNINIDIYSTYMFAIGVSLLKMLKNCLRNVDYSENASNGITQKDLETLVYLHEHILEYIVLIEDTLSYGVFIQFMATIGVICMTGFQMLVVSVKSFQFLMLVFYTGCIMFQVCLYCWFGNEILYESNGIINACYMSNWYEGTQKSKKTLHLIMERSKREIRLTAGKVFTLSLTTLLLIFRTSYSYFTVMRRMFGGD